MSFWAAPGVKVICVKDSIGSIEGTSIYPPFTKGERLTIRAVEAWKGTFFLSFVERNAQNFGHVAGFRPVIDEIDDLLLFAHHLDIAGEQA